MTNETDKLPKCPRCNNHMSLCGKTIMEDEEQSITWSFICKSYSCNYLVHIDSRDIEIIEVDDEKP